MPARGQAELDPARGLVGQRSDHHVSGRRAHVPELPFERIALKDRARSQRAVEEVHRPPAGRGRAAGRQTCARVEPAQLLAALGGLPQPADRAVQVLARCLHLHEGLRHLQLHPSLLCQRPVGAPADLAARDVDRRLHRRPPDAERVRAVRRERQRQRPVEGPQMPRSRNHAQYEWRGDEDALDAEVVARRPS